MINIKGLVAEANLKSDENGRVLKVALEALCFVDVFLHLFENVNYFLFY